MVSRKECISPVPRPTVKLSSTDSDLVSPISKVVFGELEVLFLVRPQIRSRQAPPGTSSRQDPLGPNSIDVRCYCTAGRPDATILRNWSGLKRLMLGTTEKRILLRRRHDRRRRRLIGRYRISARRPPPYSETGPFFFKCSTRFSGVFPRAALGLYTSSLAFSLDGTKIRSLRLLRTSSGSVRAIFQAQKRTFDDVVRERPHRRAEGRSQEVECGRR